MIVGEPNPSRAGNFSSAVASIMILHCSLPCDSSMPPAVCEKELLHWQTLRKSIQEVARANLAAPLDCPLSKTIQFPLDLFQNLTSISLLGDFTFSLLLFYSCLTAHTQFPLDFFQNCKYCKNCEYTIHCCYQGAFQEVNIPMNRALLPNCKIESTACLFKKNLKKNWAFKKMLRQIGITRNARGQNLDFFL